MDFRNADIHGDLSGHTGRQQVLEALHERLGGRLDSMVLCAGLGPLVKPKSEISPAVAFLLSSQASFTHGAQLFVDAGIDEQIRPTRFSARRMLLRFAATALGAQWRPVSPAFALSRHATQPGDRRRSHPPGTCRNCSRRPNGATRTQYVLPHTGRQSAHAFP